MNKKSWKQKIATILVCALITSTVSVNTAFASYTSKNMTVDNLPVKTNENEIKENGIKESISEEENSPELNRILEECKEVKADKSSTELRKGEIVSVESVSGNRTRMAIMSNGDLYCWGYNNYGQVGNDSTKNQLTPFKVLSDVKSISYCSYSVSAITENGDLYCWGYNRYGQVGNGSTKNQLTPFKVLSNVKSVSYSYAADEYYSMSAITQNRDLYCWGYNGYGQVGNGSTQNQLIPFKVLSDVKSVSYSYAVSRSYVDDSDYCSYSVSAITENGDLYCWGYNAVGQVGNGSTENQLIPFKVLSGVKSVFYFSFIGFESSVSAITENGDLYCWGYNGCGQIGNGSTEKQLTPFKVLSNVKSVSYSSSTYEAASISAIMENGDLYCWGYNRYGQVGNGSTKNQLIPFKVLSNVKSVSYSSCASAETSYFVSAITENGDLYCWGNNGSGQVGNGSTGKQLTPFKVLSNVKSSVTFLESYSMSAITENGDLYCWGNNGSGQVGNGSTENQLTPFKVLSNVKSVSCFSSFHIPTFISAITENGDLYCWGNNENGQVGNGSTGKQLTPFKVLSNVKSVSYYNCNNYYSAISISAITKNENLYCWGYNGYGQVGNGTTENQLTPFKVSFEDSSDGIARFTLSETASAKLKDNSDNTLTFSGHIYLEDGITASSEQWQNIANSIKWTTSDSSVVTDIKCQPITDSGKETSDTLIMVTVSLKSAGTATVTGTTRYGLSSSCDITVEKKEKEIRHIKGTLKEVNLNTFTVVIDNTEYEVTDSFDVSSAYGILLGGGSKTVVAILIDNKVNQMDSVEDIVEPKVSVSFEPHSISYQGGTFDNTKVKIKVSLSCGAKPPYMDSDIQGTEAENVSVNFSEYTVRIPEGLEFKETLSSSPVITDKISDTLKFGMTKNHEQTAYVKKSYVPEKVKDTLSVTVTAKCNGQETGCNAGLAVANLDKQNEIAESKNTSKEISEAEALMDKITFAMGGDGYYSKEQLNAIETVVKAWIVEMLVIQTLITDTEDNSIWAEFCKGAGYSDSQKKKFLTDIATKAFKSIGLNISPIINSDTGLHWKNTETETVIRVYNEDGKTYDKVTVKLNFGNLSFSGSNAFTGFGNLDYKIETPDKKKPEPTGVGSVTFADLQTFSECVQSICKSQIKQIFNMDIGSNLDKGADWIRKQINNVTENKLVEALTNDTTSKLLSKKFGKVSDNVFEIYTKEIIKKTNGSAHCPVDIYIYDSYGTLCGSIVNNQIETDNGDIFLYCVGDEKYFSLTGDDYKIQFVGNDEGSMTYRIDEYCNLELIRSIIYENVKLQKNKIYQGMIPQTQLLDSTIYNLVSMDNAEMIIPSSDTRMDNKTDIDSSPSQSPSSKPSNSGSPSQSPSGTGNTTSGGVNLTFVSTPSPTATVTPSPSPIVTAAPSATPVIVVTKTPLPTTTPSPEPVTTPSSDNNGDDNYNTDKVYNISGVAVANLGKETFVYNGKAKKPKVAVSKDGSKLIKNTDYTVSYYNNTKVGTASVIINGIGNYSGSINKTFKIIPKGTSIKGKVQPEHKGFTVKWKKQPTSTTGYQVQYSTNKKFSGKTTALKTVKKKSTTKLKAYKLKAKKKYYVRVRTYKTVKGKKYYSKWSKSKTVTTKR